MCEIVTQYFGHNVHFNGQLNILTADYFRYRAHNIVLIQ